MKHAIRGDKISRDEYLNVLVHSLRLIPCYYLGKEPPSWATYQQRVSFPADSAQQFSRNNFLEGVWDNPKAGFAFQDPSSRTLGSLIEGTLRFGFVTGFPYTGSQSSLAKNEPMIRTAITMLTQQHRLLAFRTTNAGAPWSVAKSLERNKNIHPEWWSQAPIINGGDRLANHITQVMSDALADYSRARGFNPHNNVGAKRLTEFIDKRSDQELAEDIEKFFKNRTWALVADIVNSRIASSVYDFAEIFDIKLILVAPKVFQPQRWRLSGVENYEIVETLDEMMAFKPDLIYTLRAKKEYLDNLPGVTSAEALSMIEGVRISPAVMEKYDYQGVITDAQPMDLEIPMIYQELWSHPQNIMDLVATLANVLRWGLISILWQGRKESLELPRVPLVTPAEILATDSIAAHHARKMAGKWKDDELEVRPLKVGQVLDRIRVKYGTKIDSILERSGIFGSGGSDAVIAKRKRSSTLGEKDIVFLKGTYVPYEVLAALMIFAPDMMVIELRDGQYTKMNFGIPPAVNKILRCPHKHCTTNHDPEAETFFYTKHLGEETFFYCDDCRNRHTLKQMVEAA